MNDGSMVQIDKQGNKINIPANDGFTPSTLGEWKGQVIASSLKQNRIMLLGKKGWHSIAGDGKVGNKNGDGRKASFNSPVGLATMNGELFIADRENHELRKLSAPKKGKVRSFSLQLSRELIGEVAAHTFGETVIMDTIRVGKKESKIHVALDLGNYKLLNEWSSVDIDEVTGAYLPTQNVTEDGFVFGINNRFEGLDVYIEVYLMLEDPDNPGIFIVKRSYLSFVLDRVNNAPAAQEQLYKVNILPQ
jgi:NHL repeat